MKISKFNKQSVFVIAELSANHGNDISVAKETIRAAKRAGADAIKLQTYTADTITLNSKKTILGLKEQYGKTSIYMIYTKEAYTPWEWHKELFDTAKQEGLLCFSSPFDFSAVDFLEELDCPIYKIASFEITDIPLIKYTASKGKPMIISTGIAEYEDIRLAIETCHSVGNNDITLLKCTSSYPAPIDEANLTMIPKLAEEFNTNVGLSDHTLGITVPIVSVALGAKVIEKHFILDKSIGGPDASFSLDEIEFTKMVKSVREAELSLGNSDFSLTDKQIKGKDFCRSLYVVENMKKGDVITNDNVKSIRPGYGLHPKFLPEILGKTVNQEVNKGERLNFDLIK